MGDNTFETDPAIIWGSIRPWIASNISYWDFLCDKGKWASYPYGSVAHEPNCENAFAYKIQVNIF